MNVNEYRAHELNGHLDSVHLLLLGMALAGAKEMVQLFSSYFGE